MTIKHLFPEAWPTLNLDFANELTLDPRITFSRSSTGTYTDKNGIIRTAAEDEPRFDYDPETGESLGLLIEEKRTNYVEYSYDLNNSYWVNRFGQWTMTGSQPAPDGTNTAVQLVDNGGGNLYRQVAFQTAASPNPTSVTWSFFAKYGGSGSNKIRINCNQQSGKNEADFNVETGVLVSSSGVETPENGTYIGNGWYRFSITDINVAANTGIGINFLSQGDTNILLWGVQIESGSFSSSYIPTTGAVEDRADDNCSIEGFDSWYNQTEGSFIYDVHVNTGYAGIAELRAGGNSGSRGRFMRQNDAYYMRLNGGRTQVNGSLTYPNGSAKLAYRMESGNHQQAVNGVIDNNYAGAGQGDPLPLYDRMWLGIGENLSVYLNGHIARISYYPHPLSDEQLQALTS